MQHPKVFISYSHDSPEHMDRVLQLSDRLRQDGIDCTIDQYEISPSEGWPRWMDKQIREADFVLLICTENYYNRMIGEAASGTGLGVRWEGNSIYNHIYQDGTINSKFIAVLFEDSMVKYIPDPLQGFNHYRINTQTGYDSLYRHLINQPLIDKPELGSIKSLPLQTRQTDFFYCIFREVSLGQTKCAKAILNNKNTTNLISSAVCNQCGIPQLLCNKLCRNLNFGIYIQNTEDGPKIINILFDCKSYEISTTNNCNPNCTYWNQVN